MSYCVQQYRWIYHKSNVLLQHATESEPAMKDIKASQEIVHHGTIECILNHFIIGFVK